MKISPIALLSASVLLSAHVVLGGGNGAAGGDADARSLLEKDEASPAAKLSLRGGGRGLYHEHEPRHLYFKGTTREVLSRGEKFGLCEGDCDVDSDCAHGHRCFQRDGFEHVPGCIGGGSDDLFEIDYCIKSDIKDDCPNGVEGYWCGNNPDSPSQGLGYGDLDDGVRYYCERRRHENGQWVGYWHKDDTCTNNHPYQICYISSRDGHDRCITPHPVPGPPPPAPHPAPGPSPECPGDVDGSYCGNNPLVSHVPHLEDGVLYECKDGHYSHPLDCEKLEGLYTDFCKYFRMRA